MGHDTPDTGAAGFCADEGMIEQQMHALPNAHRDAVRTLRISFFDICNDPVELFGGWL